MAIGEIIMFGDNVGVIFDGEAPELAVTIVSNIEAGTTPVSALPAPVDSYAPSVSPPQPEMTQVPPQTQGEAEPGLEEAPAKKPVNTWLLAGCGCLVVILLLLIALFIFIDQPWNPGGGLYCKTPFDILFRALGYCP